MVAGGVALHARELTLGRGHQQLEQELPVVLVEPVREALEPRELALVQRGVSGVVADEDL